MSSIDPIIPPLQILEVNNYLAGAGDFAQKVEWAKVADSVYTFSAFSIHKIYLSYSEVFENEAIEELKNIRREPDKNASFIAKSVFKTRDGNCKVEVKSAAHKEKKYKLMPEESVWKFFAALFSSIIFSYTAIEAFVNQLIPHNFWDPRIESLFKKNPSGTIIVPSKKNVMYLSLKDKLFEVIPIVHEKLNAKILNSKKDDFFRLESFRDMLIHLKNSDIQSGEEIKSPLWNRLTPCYPYKKLRFYPSKIAKEIIDVIEIKKPNPPAA